MSLLAVTFGRHFYTLLLDFTFGFHYWTSLLEVTIRGCSQMISCTEGGGGVWPKRDLSWKGGGGGGGEEKGRLKINKSKTRRVKNTYFVSLFNIAHYDSKCKKREEILGVIYLYFYRIYSYNTGFPLDNTFLCCSFAISKINEDDIFFLEKNKFGHPRYPI